MAGGGEDSCCSLSQGSSENSVEVGIVFGVVVGAGTAVGVGDGEAVGVEDGSVGEPGTVFGSGDAGDASCPSICCIGKTPKLVEISKQEA